ncbi:MAG: dinitrogenase iron-molybdenum cofactor biosynthesis protein [Lachnospiraceae bacterium]|nr:dinitrogenase iron-molybdenum cofactor biosynthesis protein [Lachnospiraceae bacterium]
MVNQLKGVNHMRVAVTYENGQIFQHFGHTKQFKVYEVCDGRIVSSEIVDTNGSGHGALAGVLTALNTDALICGGIGGGAQAALAAAGIKLFGGVSGDADSAVAAFASGNLEFNPNVQCNHHGEHHHHDHHDGHCGEHGCGGEHHCGNH